MLVEAQLDLINTDDWDHIMQYEVDTSQLERLDHKED